MKRNVRKHLKMSKYTAMSTENIKEKIQRLRDLDKPSYQSMMLYMELLTELEIRNVKIWSQSIGLAV